jgi:hypothetical protein
MNFNFVEIDINSLEEIMDMHRFYGLASGNRKETGSLACDEISALSAEGS